MTPGEFFLRTVGPMAGGCQRLRARLIGELGLKVHAREHMGRETTDRWEGTVS